MTNEEKKKIAGDAKTKDKIVAEKIENDEQSVAEVKGLYVSIQEAKNEVTNVLDSIDKRSGDLNRIFEDAHEKIGNLIKNLEKNTLVLHELPKKVDKKIIDIIPEITIELDKIYQKTIDKVDAVYHKKTEEINNLTKDAASKLENLKNNFANLEKGRKKRFFINFLITMLFASGVSAASAYAVLQNYPTRVYVNHNKDVLVKNSEVSFWGSGTISVEDRKQSKKKK